MLFRSKTSRINRIPSSVWPYPPPVLVFPRTSCIPEIPGPIPLNMTRWPLTWLTGLRPIFKNMLRISIPRKSWPQHRSQPVSPTRLKKNKKNLKKNEEIQNKFQNLADLICRPWAAASAAFAIEVYDCLPKLTPSPDGVFYFAASGSKQSI